MNRTEKAPTREATRAGAAAEKSGETVSDFNFSTAAASGQAGKVWGLLPEGEALAVPAADLAALAGYRSTRPLRLAVDKLRAQGVPVLASENGYYKPSPGPAGIAEMRRFLRRQDARMRSNRRTTRLIRARLRAIEKAPLDGQETMWGDDTNV